MSKKKEKSGRNFHVKMCQKKFLTCLTQEIFIFRILQFSWHVLSSNLSIYFLSKTSVCVIGKLNLIVSSIMCESLG